MTTVVREQIWPLETLWVELGWDGLAAAMAPLQEEVKEQRLWAAHLEPELGGQGYGQVVATMEHPYDSYGRYGNHAEIVYDNVRVPADALLGAQGAGS